MFYRVFFDENHPLFTLIPSYTINSDITVLEIGYNRVPPGKCQIFKRNIYIMHYIINGSGVFCHQHFDNTNGYLCVPNELEIITADEEEPYESCWIMFKGIRAAEILNQLNLKHNCVFPSKHNKECIEIIKDALFNRTYANEIEEAYMLQSVFYKLISLHMQDISENEIGSNSIANNIANYIKKNYLVPLKINDIAKTFHISRNYLYTIFKQEYNVSPQEYLISCRIEKAKKLLKSKSTPLSINEVATASGFENPLYFSRLFHDRVGVSPSQFRKNNDLSN